MAIGIIGFICRDTDIRKAHNSKIEKIGGKAYYEGITLSKLGIPSVIMIHLDDNSKDIMKLMNAENIKLYNIKSKATPRIENTYSDKEMESRKWRIISDGFRFTKEMINDDIKSCEYIILCPINPEEIDISLIKYLRKNTKAKIVADLDFYINDVKEDGSVKIMNKELLAELLSNTDIVLISGKEKNKIIKGSDEEVLKYVSEKGAKEIILTKGSKGVLIYANNKIHKINSVKPEKIVDTTGAGDTFLAAYVAARYKNKSIEEAGNFASKVASAKLKYVGALNEKINI